MNMKGTILLASLVLVFLHYDLLTPPKWAGLENITRLWTDQRMFTIYWNTLRLVVGGDTLGWPETGVILDLRAARVLTGSAVGAGLGIAGVLRGLGGG